MGAYFEKLGSKSFAVYSIAVTDSENRTWFVKRRFHSHLFLFVSIFFLLRSHMSAQHMHALTFTKTNYRHIVRIQNPSLMRMSSFREK